MSGQERFTLVAGRNVVPGELRGYYIDFRAKCTAPEWPPPWFPWPGYHRFMAVAQWGIGAYERFLEEDDETWLAAARAAADHLVDAQERDGARAGAWLEPRDQRHTFAVEAPWASAMTQGQAASLLVRVHGVLADERYASAAAAALRPNRRTSAEGGTRAVLDGRWFPEEYPTDPPSFVLNGAVFALWGHLDVALALADACASAEFEEGAETLACNLHRWDTGYWSRYDLYPHRLPNVASGFYHALHVEQLRVLALLTPQDAIAETLGRFERYAASRRARAHALVRKAAFRLLASHRNAGPAHRSTE